MKQPESRLFVALIKMALTGGFFFTSVVAVSLLVFISHERGTFTFALNSTSALILAYGLITYICVIAFTPAWRDYRRAASQLRRMGTQQRNIIADSLDGRQCPLP